MGKLLTISEYALMEGVSEKAILKRIERGRLAYTFKIVKYVETPIRLINPKMDKTIKKPRKLIN